MDDLTIPPSGVPADEERAGGPAPSEPPSRPGRRRRIAVTAVTAVTALALVGALAFLFSRGGEAVSRGGVALALSLVAGETHTYHLSLMVASTTTVDGRPSPIVKAGVEEDLVWWVVAVDPRGVATVVETFRDVRMSSNGLPVTPPPVQRPVPLRIGPDGQILSSDLALLPGVVDRRLPGNGYLLALLPEGAVHPGSTWTTSYAQRVDVVDLTVPFTAANEFLRYERFEGVRTAVVRSGFTSKVKVPLSLEKLSGILDPNARLTGPDLTGTVGLVTDGRTTTWIDPVRKVALRTLSDSVRNGAFRFPGTAMSHTDVHEVLHLELVRR